MQMIISRACVSTIANVRNRFPLFGEMTFGQTFRISIEVCVVVDEPTISTQLINRYAPAFALKKFYDRSVGRSNDGSSSRSGYINRIVNASFRARFRKSIAQLLRPHPGNGND